MNKKNIAKIILDIAMVVLFITFFNKNLVSFNFHIKAGYVLTLFVLVHMILNRKWLINITKRLFDKNIKFRVKLSYITSLLLLLCIVLIIASGICIMKAPNYDRQMFWKMTHFGASYLSIALAGIHIGLCWNFVMNMFKKVFKIKKGNKNNQMIAKALTVLLLVFGLFTTFKQGYIFRLAGTLSYSVQHIEYQGIQEPENTSTHEKKDTTFIELATTYGSIMSVFAIGAYYADNSLKNKNKSKAKQEKPSVAN